VVQIGGGGGNAVNLRLRVCEPAEQGAPATKVFSRSFAIYLANIENFEPVVKGLRHCFLEKSRFSPSQCLSGLVPYSFVRISPPAEALPQSDRHRTLRHTLHKLMEKEVSRAVVILKEYHNQIILELSYQNVLVDFVFVLQYLPGLSPA
jgi:hypothetical protein